MGWTPGYNFGTLDAVRTRWAAAVRAGVDFVATDQYEAFATTRQSMPEFRTLVLEGMLNRADSIDVAARPGSWFSAILLDASGPTTFTNAILAGSQ